MPKWCAAFACCNTNTKSESKERCISFHKFPSDPETRRQWVLATKRKNFVPSEHSSLCSVHFTDDCYIPGLARKKLFPNAVPTLFPGLPNYYQAPVKRRNTAALEKQIIAKAVAVDRAAQAAREAAEAEADSPEVVELKQRVQFLENSVIDLREKLDTERRKSKVKNTEKHRLHQRVTRLKALFSELKNPLGIAWDAIEAFVCRTIDTSESCTSSGATIEMAAQRTSITPLMNQSNGDKNSVVVEVIDEGIVREKVLSEITDMIESSFESRIKVMKWRAILGVHHPNDEATPESLFERLDRLKNLSGIGDSSDEGEDSAATVHRKLIGLRKRVMDNKTAFYTILSELEGRLSGGELDENEITTKADERDRLAEILVQNVESFITALSSNTEIVQKRISEIKEMAFDIDFLLSMCPSSETLEDDPEIESRGRELWTKFASSDELRRLTEATDQASVRMDSSRQAFGFITGALGLEATKLGSQSVKSFFPNLDSLNKAMKNELEAYKRQLVSGQQGKITSACLSRFNKCISGLVLELNNLETDKYAMTEYNHKASEILSARSVMTEDTIESMEMTSQQMKKIRSRLRHHLADLEDLMENDEESEEVQECRKSIEEIRQELHAVLKDTMKQKEFVTQALSMRPELSLNLVRLLKSAGPSMCDSDSIISWETFYFDMKPMNTGKTRYASRFGDEDVIIKKILVTDDGERLRTQIKAYQEAVSLSDSCLLPIIAAFVPPKESLVLYLIFPSYASCDAPTDTADYLKHVLGFLSGFRSLRKAGLPCVYNFPLSHLVKVNGRSQPLLKPSAFLEASTSTTDFIGIIRSLKTTAANAKVERFLVEEIFHDANSAEDIDIVISRISNLLKDEALTGTLELEEKPDQLFTVCEPPATTSYDEELMDIKEEIKEEF